MTRTMSKVNNYIIFNFSCKTYAFDSFLQILLLILHCRFKKYALFYKKKKFSQEKDFVLSTGKMYKKFEIKGVILFFMKL